MRLRQWLLELLAVSAAAGVALGSQCRSGDHEECDLECKASSFWYGACWSWDGSELECRCEEYEWPLSGGVCSSWDQHECRRECGNRTQLPGFCQVVPSVESWEGSRECKCYSDIVDFSYQPYS